MARTQLSVTEIDSNGVSDAGTAGIADGHSFVNHGQEFVEVSNSDTVAHTVTFPTPDQIAGLNLEDRAVSIPAGGSLLIGRFPRSYFNQSGADANKVYIDYEGGAESMFTVSAFRLRPVS